MKNICRITCFFVVALLAGWSCHRQLRDPVSHSWGHPSDSCKNTVITNANPSGLDVLNQDGELIYRYNIGKVSDFCIAAIVKPDGSKSERLIAFDDQGDTLMTLLIDPAIGTLTPVIREPA